MRLVRLRRRAVVALVMLIIWYLITASGLVREIFLPSPVRVSEALLRLSVSGTLPRDLWHTVARALTGLAIGATLGISLGIPLGYSPRLYQFLDLPIDFFRSVPTTALFPLFLLLFGVGDSSKVVIVAFSTSLILLVNTVDGVRSGNKTRRMVAQSLRATELQMLTKVTLPDALPHIFTGLRIALSLSLVLVVVLEMFIGTTTGLGRRISDSHQLYRIPEMYSAILVTGATGYLLNVALRLLAQRVVHWRGRA